jgi:hypothetical protein
MDGAELLSNWITNLMRKGLSVGIKRYYSIYRGVVTDNKDPDSLGRIQVVCNTVGQTEAPDVWAMPATMGGGNRRGMFFVPEVGDSVWVSFYEGDADLPEVYWGGWYGEVADEPFPKSDPAEPTDVPIRLAPKPKGSYPEKKGFTTRAGHSLIFSDEDGKESITILWNQPADGDPAKTDRTKTAKLNPKKSTFITLDAKGGFLVKTASSYIIQIDEGKGALTIASPKGSMYTISSDDAVAVFHKSGGNILMNDSGITISAAVSKQQNVNISGQSVAINGGSVLVGGKAIDFAVLGLKLIKWLALHTHPYPFGVVLPPVPPPTPLDFCSQTVKVQD